MPNTRPPDTENPGIFIFSKSPRPLWISFLLSQDVLLVFMKIALVHFFLFMQIRTGSRPDLVPLITHLRGQTEFLRLEKYSLGVFHLDSP
jgi:hypothetical protein